MQARPSLVRGACALLSSRIAFYSGDCVVATLLFLGPRRTMQAAPIQPPASTMMPPAASSHTAAAVVVKLTVTVPPSISGGDLVRVAAPDGSYHSIMVPSGLSSGQQFSVELLATNSSSSASAAEVQRLRMELDAERMLRRETQQEALRSRTALEALQLKRAADHAYFRDVIKRQRRCIETYLGTLEESSS